MPSSSKVTVRGLNNVRRELRGFSRDWTRQRREIGAIVNRAVAPAVADIRAELPHRTGDLKQDLRTRIRSFGALLVVTFGWDVSDRPVRSTTQRTGKVLGALYGNRHFPRPARDLLERVMTRHQARIEREVNQGLRRLWRQ